MKWWRFWAETFILFRGKYQPFARSICFLILPSHEDWPIPVPANTNEVQ